VHGAWQLNATTICEKRLDGLKAFIDRSDCGDKADDDEVADKKGAQKQEDIGGAPMGKKSDPATEEMLIEDIGAEAKENKVANIENHQEGASDHVIHWLKTPEIESIIGLQDHAP
jgi:hypothetical protein